MHLDVSLQLAQLAVSMLTGLGLGIAYDVLRALRRELHRNAALDMLFCAVLLFALFVLGMDIGQGEVHIFMFCAAAAGFSAYMALLSPVILPAFTRLTGFAVKIFAPVKKFIKKVADCVKKCFSRAFNWYIMKKQSRMKKSTTIIGLALTMLAAYAILNLASLKRDLNDAMEQTSALRAEIAEAQAEGGYLEEQIQNIHTDDGIESLAQHRLRLIGADEKIFRDIRG